MVEKWSEKCQDIPTVFKVNETADWIKKEKFSRVGLQFPDELLGISVVVCRQLNSLTDSLCAILGDSSFASCCVDEIAGQHVNVDAVVHYGRACLSENTGRIPVFYVFGKYSPCIPTEIETCYNQVPLNLVEKILSYLEDLSVIVITYDFRFKDVAQRMCKEIMSICDSREIKSLRLIWSEPYFNTSANKTEKISDNSQTNQFIRCGRLFTSTQSEWSIPSSTNERSWHMLYIGHTTETESDLLPLYRILVSLPEVNTFTTCVFDPVTCNLDVSGIEVNRLLKRRTYLIEKAKDAQFIGILVSTLSTKNYQSIVDRLKELLKRAKRSCITLVVGRLNAAKLANLPELQLLVLVACPEISLLNSREFHIPIITPFEMECALRSCCTHEQSSFDQLDNRMWTEEKFWVDFCDLLPGGRAYVPIEDVVSEVTESFADVSLVNGHSRLVPSNVLEDDNIESQSLVVRTPGELIESGCWNLGSNKVTRTWYGLNPEIGQTPVAQVKDGRKGLPTQYTHENSTNAPN
uniref:2-(3-amino-3-carboxypropyl)histidine synthase subunit 2 n=1 Tax=Trichobilharzia regenti TaxID=157069 RepID=A0AA85J0U1_TRIRE|nr:unnamed protein product [Trichobilharzia regenti]